jgi:hypothetical protein
MWATDLSIVKGLVLGPFTRRSYPWNLNPDSWRTVGSLWRLKLNVGQKSDRGGSGTKFRQDDRQSLTGDIKHASRECRPEPEAVERL